MAPYELLEYSNTLITQGEKIESFLIMLSMKSNSAASFSDLLSMSPGQTERLKEEIIEMNKKKS